MVLTPKKQLVVKRSLIPNAGKGLFTKTFIPKGQVITEYKGKISTWEDADHDDGKNLYIYYVSKNHVIDAMKYKSSLARYANDANGFKKTRGNANNSTYIIENDRVFIKAIKNIEPGAEILVSYGKKYWDTLLKLN
jgi:uncharacterized protein